VLLRPVTAPHAPRVEPWPMPVAPPPTGVSDLSAAEPLAVDLAPPNVGPVPAVAVAEPESPADEGAVDPVRLPPPPSTGVAPHLVMTALAAANAAALTIEADGRIASATAEAERLLGTPIAHLRGMRVADLLELGGPAEQALAAARRGRSRQSVVAVVSADGCQVAVEWVPSGEAEAGIMVLVSDQPASDDAEGLRLQTRLVAFVAHDVRNCLANVACCLHTLSDVTPATAAERPVVDRGLTEIHRASHIVDDVLAVSRPGRLVLVAMDLNVVLRSALNRFRGRATANGTEIREQLETRVRVLVDLVQLERVFDNLIENALQAMPHYGTLTVATMLEDRGRPGVRITFTDTGVGIPPDVALNVFEPFVTTKADGNGLGLALVRRVVLDHEGQIDFETQVGRGTSFMIWLPRLCPDPLAPHEVKP